MIARDWGEVSTKGNKETIGSHGIFYILILKVTQLYTLILQNCTLKMVNFTVN